MYNLTEALIFWGVTLFIVCPTVVTIALAIDRRNH